MTRATSMDWTPQIAEEAAGREGTVLGEKHWCAITSSRELKALKGRAPSLGEVGAMCGVTVVELKNHFPGTAEEILARPAGAPDPERKGQ